MAENRDTTTAGVTGVILAGGLGRRMGGVDKGLQDFRGLPLVLAAIERLRPQVGSLLINANQNRDTYAAFGYPVVADAIDGFAGPLAGLHAGMLAAPDPLVVTAPCDSPLLPTDLVARLRSGLERAGAQLALACAEGRRHPVFCLCPTTLAPELAQFLTSGQRRMADWFATLKVIDVDFDDCPQAFLNINTPDELQQLAAPGEARSRT